MTTDRRLVGRLGKGSRDMSSTTQVGRGRPVPRTGHATRTVRIGPLAVGDGPVPLIGGRATGGAGPDAHWVSLREHQGRVPAAEAIAGARVGCDVPLLVEPYSAADLTDIAEAADGVVIGAAWTREARLVRAVAGLGLPILARRDPDGTLEEWLAVAGQCAAEGNHRVVLCEGGSTARPSPMALDLALMRSARERSGLPVAADLGDDPALAAAAVAAGADALLLARSAEPAVVEAAREAATVIGAVTRHEAPESIPAARDAIDRVDAVLATLLERRAALAGIVQRLKPVGGFAGRDLDRERRLVAAMARRAPRLGEARLAPVMNAVIEAGLLLAEQLDEEETEEESA
jgi:chorismate mutase